MLANSKNTLVPHAYWILAYYSASLSLVVLLFISTCMAQQPQWPYTGPAFAASPADIQAAAAKIAAEPFMEATVFFERDAYSIDTAARMTCKHTLIYRVETEGGIEDWSEIRMRWFPWYQKSPEINARVIGSDGKVSILDPKTITDGPAHEDNEDTFVDDRVHKVPLPGIAAGSIVEEEETVTDTSPYFAEGRVYTDSYSRSVPSIRVELLIDVPASTRFRFKVHSMPTPR